MPITRRTLLTGCVVAAGAGWFGARRLSQSGIDPGSPVLRVRPGKATGGPSPAGASQLGLGRGRDGQLFVPHDYSPDRPLPLVLLLHGATMSGGDMVGWHSDTAEQAGVILLAPDSRGYTWDAIRGEFGPDPLFLEQSLVSTWSRYAVDPNRVTIAGFSDGATYALALGLANGGLFPRVAAFSPGFLIPVPTTGKPEVFISHGTSDKILPIDRTSRLLVPTLKREGYQVDYREFEGGHTVPAEIAGPAFRWLAGKG